MIVIYVSLFRIVMCSESPKFDLAQKYIFDHVVADIARGKYPPNQKK